MQRTCERMLKKILIILRRRNLGIRWRLRNFRLNITRALPLLRRNRIMMKNEEEVVRAYSMASYPAEGRKIMLNVRVATPPWDKDKNDFMDVNPGIASSYIFGLKEIH